MQGKVVQNGNGSPNAKCGIIIEGLTHDSRVRHMSLKFAFAGFVGRKPRQAAMGVDALVPCSSFV